MRHRFKRSLWDRISVIPKHVWSKVENLMREIVQWYNPVFKLWFSIILALCMVLFPSQFGKLAWLFSLTMFIFFRALSKLLLDQEDKLELPKLMLEVGIPVLTFLAIFLVPTPLFPFVIVIVMHSIYKILRVLDAQCIVKIIMWLKDKEAVSFAKDQPEYWQKLFMLATIGNAMLLAATTISAVVIMPQMLLQLLNWLF